MNVEKCNQERLWNSIMEIGQIGHVDVEGSKVGGCHRLALTDKDKQARDLFIGWAKEIGCTLRVDAVGNIFLRRAGTDNDLPPVITGSHLDTQPTGGKFDGIFGCLAGLETLRCLEEQNIKTLRPIEVVVWTNEEGARFKPAMLGSGVYAGVFKLNDVLTTKDESGITLGDELSRLGYQELINNEDPGCYQYYEIHIEQGPVLEALEIDLGIVAGVLGMRWYDVEVTGRSCHAGPSPMNLRNDALVGVAEMITELTKLASSFSKDSRCTFGELNIPNSSTNVSPGKVNFSLDLREGRLEELDELQTKAFEIMHRIAFHHDLELSIKETWSLPPCPFDESCLTNIQQACEATYPEIKPHTLISGAGHDAVYISRVAPTAMIFVPSEDGLSHNEREYTSPEQLEKGCNVLLNTIILAANAE
ncbi:Zn-dependent hydrolase [Cocleimonas flava]|jgi:N-carbamoyl-L-amino-acid hydrolase|uniref:N-carbamoyl-L-amino-acid hydrolase n=1 Tax=Cocleimonas flava TaxID=634765 RepID=A0A4R1EP17_9GAMM|nr:M20 family metallo-hydrolase [Cocleimonas flava]TCJ82723.1 N-carbamoyl-L-amino-acid hydrolase [Cocleimonas flava]